MTLPMKENMPDPIDRASDLEMMSTEDAIRAVRRLNVQKQKPDAKGNYAEPDCEECGQEIGEGRLKVAQNNHLCIHCATLAERWQR